MGRERSFRTAWDAGTFLWDGNVPFLWDGNVPMGRERSSGTSTGRERSSGTATGRERSFGTAWDGNVPMGRFSPMPVPTDDVTHSKLKFRR